MVIKEYNVVETRKTINFDYILTRANSNNIPVNNIAK